MTYIEDFCLSEFGESFTEKDMKEVLSERCVKAHYPAARCLGFCKQCWNMTKRGERFTRSPKRAAKEGTKLFSYVDGHRNKREVTESD